MRVIIFNPPTVNRQSSAAMRKALAKIAKMPVVKGKPVMIRVESLQ